MEFVLGKNEKKNYTGDIKLYWLERNITFLFGMDKLSEDTGNLILKLDYCLEGTYRISHNLKNKHTNKYDTHTLELYIDGVLKLPTGLKHKSEWVYFEIKKDDSETIIISNYDKNKFIGEERAYKNRKLQMDKEYWFIYWKCLHFISYIYPKNPTNALKLSMIELFNILKSGGLKCPICTHHFGQYIKSLNIEEIINNNESLKTFFINLHNNVNKRHKKREFSRREVDKFYEDKKNIEKYLLDLGFGLALTNMLKEERIHEFPNIYNNEGRLFLKKKWRLFILEK